MLAEEMGSRVQKNCLTREPLQVSHRFWVETMCWMSTPTSHADSEKSSYRYVCAAKIWDFDFIFSPNPVVPLRSPKISILDFGLKLCTNKGLDEKSLWWKFQSFWLLLSGDMTHHLYSPVNLSIFISQDRSNQNDWNVLIETFIFTKFQAETQNSNFWWPEGTTGFC